jgi:hypothetical protein
MIHFTNHRTVRACGAGFAAAILLALAPAVHASLYYSVTLNVGSLQSNPDGPFSLDLQLISGSQGVTNSVYVNSFSYTNTSLSGTAQTIGLASGSAASGISLTTNSGTGFSDFYQPLSISSGTASISFIVAQSLNSEVGTGAPTPDQFEVFLDDGNTTDGYVPTTAPGGVDALAISTISDTETVSQIGSYSSTSPDAGVTTAVAVPEPGSAGLLLLGVAGLVARRKRSATAQIA